MHRSNRRTIEPKFLDGFKNMKAAYRQQQCRDYQTRLSKSMSISILHTSNFYINRRGCRACCIVGFTYIFTSVRNLDSLDNEDAPVPILSNVSHFTPRKSVYCPSYFRFRVIGLASQNKFVTFRPCSVRLSRDNDSRLFWRSNTTLCML